ncbi:MAG: PHP domain-containing protein [Firmicutes bacterium]|nr:PHP domain-containing protein [Bacillota bacterium]
MINPDLHLHTYYSDGKESPAVVVARAKAMGIDVMAITDHDGMGGVEEAVEEGRRLGVRVVRGVEFSAEYAEDVPGFEGCTHYMHILGYGMDPSNPELDKALAYIQERREWRNEALRQVFCELGYPMTMEELKAQSINGFVGKVSFARLLVAKGYCETVVDAFDDDKMLMHPKVKAIHRYKIPAAEAIRVIREAGGKAFFAHPFQLSFKPPKREEPEVYRQRQEAVIRALKDLGMAGIECWYPTHTPEQTAYLLDLAKRLGMLVSKGSDDHGANARPVKKMGNFSTEVDLSMLQWVEEYLD